MKAHFSSISAFSIKEFEALISEFKVGDDDETNEQSGILISEAELLAQREKVRLEVLTVWLVLTQSSFCSSFRLIDS